MKTLQEIASNLGMSEDNKFAIEIYQEQFIKGKFQKLITGKYLSIDSFKELNSLETNDMFCLSNEDKEKVKKNKARYSEILGSAITLEEAYKLSI